MKVDRLTDKFIALQLVESEKERASGGKKIQLTVF